MSHTWVSVPDTYSFVTRTKLQIFPALADLVSKSQLATYRHYQTSIPIIGHMEVKGQHLNWTFLKALWGENIVALLTTSQFYIAAEWHPILILASSYTIIRNDNMFVRRSCLNGFVYNGKKDQNERTKEAQKHRTRFVDTGSIRW